MGNYVLDIKNFWFKIEPNRNDKESWEIMSFSDSSYACDPVT